MGTTPDRCGSKAAALSLNTAITVGRTVIAIVVGVARVAKVASVSNCSRHLDSDCYSNNNRNDDKACTTGNTKPDTDVGTAGSTGFIWVGYCLH